MNQEQNKRPPNTTDYGPKPFVININQAAQQNPNYRTTLWTGEHLQVTLMCIPVGGEVGLEVHNIFTAGKLGFFDALKRREMQGNLHLSPLFIISH